MYLKKIIGLLFLFSLFVINNVQAKTFNVEEFYLDNGLQVILVENHVAPIVKQMLFYKVGAVDELPGKGGIAHLLEHLMFRGTRKVKGQQFNKLMEQNGAQSNAFTSHDVTAYHQLVDVSRLELAMFLEADRMNNLKISDKDFEIERNIVFQERKQRIDNNPKALFMEQISKVLWQNHPYGRAVAGSDEEILNLKKEDAVKFYDMYYAPNNAVLVLAGDLDKDTAKKLAEKYYGNLKKRDFKKQKFAKIKENYKAKVEAVMPDIKQDRMVKLFVVPSLKQNSKMAYALDVLAEYLGGSINSPLYQKLVVADRKAVDLSLAYNGISRDYGDFALSVVPAGDLKKDFEKDLKKAWDYALKVLDEKKLEAVKQKMAVSMIYLQSDLSGLASLAGRFAASDLKIEMLNNYVDDIEKVSVEDVKKAADFVWNNAVSVSGMLYAKGTNNE